jgi:hypothetical protein
MSKILFSVFPRMPHFYYRNPEMPGPGPELKKKVGRLDVIDEENITAMEMQAEEDALDAGAVKPRLEKDLTFPGVDQGPAFNLSRATGVQAENAPRPSRIRPPGKRYGLERFSAVEKKPAIETPDEAHALELDNELEIPDSHIEALVETREAAEKVTEKWWQKIAKNTKKVGAAASNVITAIAREATQGVKNLGADVMNIPADMSKKFAAKKAEVTFQSLLEKPKEHLASTLDLVQSAVTDPLDLAYGYKLAVESMPAENSQDTQASWLAKEGLQGAKEVADFFKEGVTDSLRTFGLVKALENLDGPLRVVEQKRSEPLLELNKLTRGRAERYDQEVTETEEQARQAILELGLGAIQAREQFEQEHAEVQAEILMQKLEDALADAKSELKKSRSKTARQMLETKIQGIEQDINEHEKLMGLVKQCDMLAEDRDRRAAA